jgi:thymidylate synthase (FAD)
LVPPRTEVFPPHGFCELVDWTGSELDIVNAARTSFAKHSESLTDKDKGLLRYLMREHHGTPFEMGFRAQFHIRMPIFVMRELVRHRAGFSINEESGRYSELRPHFYLPDPEDIRTQVGKPGAYSFEPVNDPELVDWFLDGVADLSSQAFGFYREAVERGIAREQARIILPLNLFTEIRWSINARSLMNFLSLRNHPQAMYEIRRYAEALEQIFASHMPTVHEAFLAGGRVAP